jgi:hypothetical protein
MARKLPTAFSFSRVAAGRPRRHAGLAVLQRDGGTVDFLIR